MPSSPVIRARELSKSFGLRRAIHQLDFEAHGGETVAIFGPNGAGKTTLVRLLTLELQPDSGRIELFGRRAGLSHRDVRMRCGVLSHKTQLYDPLTASENLVFFGRLFGVPDANERAAELLHRFGLEARADDAVGHFSRGMRQRVALARCLMHDPELVFLDEPFAGLDPGAAGTLTETLARLHARHRTVLLVTHDLAQGLRLSQRWILMGEGRLLDDGESASTDPVEFETRFRAHLAAGGRLRSAP